MFYFVALVERSLSELIDVHLRVEGLGIFSRSIIGKLDERQ